jgi:hypothetical protein
MLKLGWPLLRLRLATAIRITTACSGLCPFCAAALRSLHMVVKLMGDGLLVKFTSLVGGR